ncbi:MAG: HAD-IA family hydrolase [Pseudomonadota bacterium]|nr:HAD-IA family hydrolase [Pseudomonadota bacterium]
MDVKALFVDAAGTLLRPREPIGMTYSRFARARGHDADPVEVELRFRAALKRSGQSRQQGDGREFWARVVAESVGVEDTRLFEDLYDWYGHPKAWWIDTEALDVLGKIARQGVRLGIISNWDRRLRALYQRFALERMFTVLICSAELGVEKPDPWIFKIACRTAGVSPRQAVHIGDDPEKDVAGANRAGLVGMLYDDDEGWRGLPHRIAVLRRAVFR